MFLLLFLYKIYSPDYVNITKPLTQRNIIPLTITKLEACLEMSVVAYTILEDPGFPRLFRR